MHVKIYSHFEGRSWEGEVDASLKLEDMFRFFNRVTDEDCERLEGLGYDLPSLSVGDVVEILNGEAAWRVDPVGFQRVA